MFIRSRYRYPHLRGPRVYLVVIMQLSVTLAISLVSLLYSSSTAVSVLLGGLACSLPNAYLVWKAFRYNGARSAKEIVTSFYQGGAGKFLLTTAAFVLIFFWASPIDPLVLFGTYFLVHMAGFVPLLLSRN